MLATKTFETASQDALVSEGSIEPVMVNLHVDSGLKCLQVISTSHIEWRRIEGSGHPSHVSRTFR